METQKLLYQISIYEDDIVLSSFNHEGGTAKRFLVTPEQLGGFFSPSFVFHPEEGLVWERRENGSRTVLYTFPKSKDPVTVYVAQPMKKGQDAPRISRYRMLLPALAVHATIDSVSNGVETIQAIRLWCMSDDRLMSQTKLYEPPFPNCTGSSMCIGNVKRTVKGTTRDSLWKVIFDTVFNHHSNHVGKGGKVFHDFAREYRGKRIPIDALVEIKHVSAKTLLEPSYKEYGRI